MLLCNICQRSNVWIKYKDKRGIIGQLVTIVTWLVGPENEVKMLVCNILQIEMIISCVVECPTYMLHGIVIFYKFKSLSEKMLLCKKFQRNNVWIK